MFCPSRFQSSYRLALRPLGRHLRTITASNHNLSMTVHKHEGGGVQPEIPQDKQGSINNEPKIEARLETRPQPGSNKELQILDDWWLKYSQEREKEREQEQKQELQKKTAEIQNLTVLSPVMISMLLLISL